MVRVSEEREDDSAFDTTLYTSVACAESGRFYWTTYENQNIQYVDLKPCASGIHRYSLTSKPNPIFSCGASEVYGSRLRSMAQNSNIIGTSCGV